jgi:hypothetical protein
LGSLFGVQVAEWIAISKRKRKAEFIGKDFEFIGIKKLDQTFDFV